MTSHASYAAYWRAFNERQDWPLWQRTCHRIYSAEVDWASNPSGRADLAFENYLDFRIWSLGQATPLATYCLGVAKAQAQEATKIDGFEKVSLPGSFPLNRFNFLYGKVLIDGVVRGEPFDRSTVLQLARDAVVVAGTYGRREWDALPQSQYLHVIDLLLLVDAADEAKSLIAEARSMRGLHVKDLFESARAISKDARAIRDDALARDKYRSCFDLLRDPQYSDRDRGHPATTMQLFIMACMWQKFFVPGDGSYNYDVAIDLIWE
jgi:hypothetical protein